MILWYEIVVIYYFMCHLEDCTFKGPYFMIEDIGKFCMQVAIPVVLESSHGDRIFKAYYSCVLVVCKYFFGLFGQHNAWICFFEIY
jgi:hypothetical protein